MTRPTRPTHGYGVCVGAWVGVRARGSWTRRLRRLCRWEMGKVLKVNNSVAAGLDNHVSGEASGVRRLDIQEFLAWVYLEQRADQVAKRSNEPPVKLSAGSNMWALERYGTLGAMVDGGGQALVGGTAIHADAEAAHEAVLRLDRMVIGLVIAHAKMMEVPDWVPGYAPRLVAKRNRRGKPEMLYQDEIYKKGARCCLLVCEPMEYESVHFMRVAYGRWWDALASLVAGGLGEMVEHEVTGPKVAREPWLLPGGGMDVSLRARAKGVDTAGRN